MKKNKILGDILLTFLKTPSSDLNRLHSTLSASKTIYKELSFRINLVRLQLKT